MDFNRYARGRTVLGLKSIILKNLVQQPSMIAEQVTMALFERMGQPVPRESFSRLYINNVYQGVYSIVESVDEDFLERTVGRNDGYLFSYQFGPEIPPFWGGDLGDDYAPYKVLFEPETTKREQIEQRGVKFDPRGRVRIERHGWKPR